MEQCKVEAEEALYKGGILKEQEANFEDGDRVDSLSFRLKNLDAGTKYCFSS